MLPPPSSTVAGLTLNWITGNSSGPCANATEEPNKNRAITPNKPAGSNLPSEDFDLVIIRYLHFCIIHSKSIGRTGNYQFFRILIITFNVASIT